MRRTAPSHARATDQSPTCCRNVTAGARGPSAGPCSRGAPARAAQKRAARTAAAPSGRSGKPARRTAPQLGAPDARRSCMLKVRPLCGAIRAAAGRRGACRHRMRFAASARLRRAPARPRTGRPRSRPQDQVPCCVRVRFTAGAFRGQAAGRIRPRKSNVMPTGALRPPLPLPRAQHPGAARGGACSMTSASSRQAASRPLNSELRPRSAFCAPAASLAAPSGDPGASSRTSMNIARVEM